MTGENKTVRFYDLIHGLYKKGDLDDFGMKNSSMLCIDQFFWSEFLFNSDLYQKILPVPGCIMEFGVRYGKNLVQFMSMRSALEPRNLTRKIIGFDTFDGLIGVEEKDGGSIEDYMNVPNGWGDILKQMMDFHQNNSNYYIKDSHEIVVGDASIELPKYIEKHPDTIVSLAYFDFDIYKPTRDCLEAILPHMPKGSIIAFDELSYSKWPGETIAVKEVLDITKHKFRRSRFGGVQSYLVIE